MDQSTRTKESPGDHGRMPPTELAAFAARAFAAAGLPDSDAQIVADLMMEADLRGSDTHGVIRLPLYVRRQHQSHAENQACQRSRIGGADRRR